MRTKEHRAIAWLSVLFLTFPGLASAITQGRLIGKVVDPEGRPIPGVRVTTTCAEIPDFRQVMTTNDKGIFKVDFERINVVYLYELEKAGHVTLKIEQKWTLEGTERHEFRMYPAETPTVDGPAPASAPAIQLGDEAKATKAREDLERLGRLREEAKRIFAEGVRLSKAADEEGAFAKFREALELDPNLEPALLGLAASALKLDRAAEAAAAAETLLKVDPRHAEALKIRYNAALKLKDEAKLADALLGLAAVDAATARDGLFLLARMAFQRDDTAKAKERFRHVLEIDPMHGQSHYFLGRVLMREGAKEEAKSHFERFLELAPDDPDAATARDALRYLRQS